MRHRQPKHPRVATQPEVGPTRALPPMQDDRQPISLGDPDQQRARHRLALEFGSREEFEDPRFGYRRVFAEVLGTFLLVLAAAGGGVLHAKGQISLSAAVVAPGHEGTTQLYPCSAKRFP